MTIATMLGQSAILTLLGMGVVFAFLVVLILCMHALHGVIHALKLDKDKKSEATVKSASVSAAPAAPSQDNAVVAAIAAAVKNKQ